MPIALIPFAVFFACCLVQFFFLHRVRQALSARHPEIWEGLSGKALFADNALAKFVHKRGDRRLRDPELTCRVEQLRALYAVAICAWGAFVLALVTGVGRRTLPLPRWPGYAAGPSAGPVVVAASGSGVAVTPTLLAGFAAVFAVTAVYLVLVLCLIARWNASSLGARVTMTDSLGALGVIWRRAPGKRDATFLRLRAATRTAFVMAVVGILAGFAVVFRAAAG